MKRFLIYLKGRPLPMASVILLIILYLSMIFAEFIAPYGPNSSFPEYTCHPPNARFHQGGFKVQEHRVINTVNWKYVRIKDQFADIRFFGKGEPYKLWGLISMERRLFTTNDYPVFLMGADTLGRDLFSRIIYGSRISLTIGFVATAISLLLAIFFGGLAGYFGGKTDWLVMRFAEFLMLIPGLYLILFLRSLLSGQMDTGQAFMMITLILSLVGWPGTARTLRGMIHSIKREEFIQNAQLEMIPSMVIIFRHIIPQIASLLIVSIALSVPGFIMTETVLSYLGLGIADPAVSWGSLIRRDISTISNLMAYPWLLSPVWFLLGVTFSFNFLGDALRDYFDPYHTVFRKRGIPFLKYFSRFRAILRHPGCNERCDIRGADAQSTQRDFETMLPIVSETDNLLEVKDLQVIFSVLRGRKVLSVNAVRGVSFTIKKGEVLGIVGESGSGKSVTTQSLPGLLPASATVSGSILYEGKNILGLSAKELKAYRGKKIGMIFQEPGRSYDPLQNMKSVFLETFRNSDPNITKEEAMDKAVILLDEVGLPHGRERLSNFPHQFSGGQLQRIGIALALAQGCDLLIADEPTTALDVTIQKQIMELLKELRQTRRISIIFISHNIDLVADISDRILVMYGGLVMEAAPANSIYSSAIHPYTKALLAASPCFGSHYTEQRLKVIPGKVADPANPEPGCPFAPRCEEAVEECRKSIPPIARLKDSVHEFRCIKGSNHE
ncbi:MAG: ATP-binding cassette domain-containing protein [Spirochaetaceae bacterium]|nr:ATP-binding cassette domain-containing protein [Spirochaetaceae bacterium]